MAGEWAVRWDLIKDCRWVVNLAYQKVEKMASIVVASSVESWDI